MNTTKKKGKRPARRPPGKKALELGQEGIKGTLSLPQEGTGLSPGKTSPVGSKLTLRALAGVYYATRQDMPSVDVVAAMPEFSGVKVRTVQNWANKDNWTEHRRLFQESVLEKVRKRVGNELVQAQIKMLQDCNGLYDQTLDMLLGNGGTDRPPARSYEGLIRAHMDMVAKVSEIRRGVIDLVAPPALGEPVSDATTEETGRVAPELTHEEARIAALAVVRARRSLQGDDDADEG